MKKVFTVLSLCVLMLSSRQSAAQMLYDKGDVLINAGLGFGYLYGGGGIPIVASAEFAITDAISIGPYISFTSRTRSYGGFGATWSYNYTFIDFGGRGSYHFSKHINMNTDKLDLYGSLLLGYVVSSYTVKDGSGTSTVTDDYGNRVSAGVVGGARWYFTDSFSVNGEVGYGLAPLMLGISFKL